MSLEGTHHRSSRWGSMLSAGRCGRKGRGGFGNRVGKTTSSPSTGLPPSTAFYVVCCPHLQLMVTLGDCCQLGFIGGRWSYFLAPGCRPSYSISDRALGI